MKCLQTKWHVTKQADFVDEFLKVEKNFHEKVWGQKNLDSFFYN
jgi:hypothetical protein